MTEHTATILELTRWSAQEIHDIVENNDCPDHWYNDPVPTIALLELIRSAIESSDNSYRKAFPTIIDTLHLKQPKHLVGLISKIKRHVIKAEKTGNFLLLCQEIPELSRSAKEVIGPACSSVGILPNWFDNDEGYSGIVTNHIIIELQRYRSRKNIIWKTVVNKWWVQLFPGKIPPAAGTVISSWNKLNERKIEISRDWSSEEKGKFLATPYQLPSPLPPRDVIQPELGIDNDENLVTADDSGYDTDCSDDTTIRHMLRSHGDTVTILHELLEVEKQDRIALQVELANEKEARQNIEAELHAAQQTVKKGMVDRFNSSQDHKTQRTKYEQQLKKAHELSAKLQMQTRSLDKSNVVRRLATSEQNLAKQKIETLRLKEEVEELKNEVKRMSGDLHEKRRITKNRTEQLRYHKLKRGSDQELSEEENGKLRGQLSELEKENDQLRCDLDEIMGDREITTFEDGRYSEDIRVVCYELISHGVGSRHVSDIIRLVLNRIGGFDCGRLPKPTLIRLMAFEQALLAKDAARAAIESCATPITLQMDGTSKKHVPYVTMLASTDKGTYGLSLNEVRTENADILLEETISAVQDLLSISDVVDDQKKVNTLLLKMKNTMTDRCIVNKKLVRLLEQWREETLPGIVDNWDQLSDETKDNMKTVNDLYCGKHVVLNLQEYAGSALSDWEVVEANGEKLGREKHLLWNRGKESATLLAVRTVCEAFGPDANAQAGAPIEFCDSLHRIGEKSRLQAYRGNRFNVPFENASAVYFHYHKGHITNALECLPPTKQKNQLMRSVRYDLQDDIILGGIRAMGVINCHITKPLMSMLDRSDSDISVMDTSRYYTQLHDAVQKWMVDPQELLDDSAIMFADFIPIRDDVHRSLYAATNENIEFNTKQAISIILHNMYVCIKRQLEDHLPGGKYHTAGEDLRQETATCPKDNVAAERVFAGLDYLKRKSPNMTALAMQGVLLWSQNKTLEYIDTHSSEERKLMINRATKNRKHVVKLYHEKIKLIKTQRNQEVADHKKAREAKELRIVAQTVSNTDNALKLCGIICKDSNDVDKLLQELETNPGIREALLSQIRYYKSVNRGVVKGSLFFVTTGGKPLTKDELVARLKEILLKLRPSDGSSSAEIASTSTSVEATATFKDSSRAELKKKLLEKLKSHVPKGSSASTGVKRKNPFPQNVINKRIRHTCLTPCGNQLEVYKGTIIRKSTASDVEELMEEEYRSHLEQGFTFYTVIYDPPYDQLYTYPLKHEWDNGLLAIM